MAEISIQNLVKVLLKIVRYIMSYIIKEKETSIGAKFILLLADSIIYSWKSLSVLLVPFCWSSVWFIREFPIDRKPADIHSHVFSFSEFVPVPFTMLLNISEQQTIN